jgi:hypothetical protein
MLLSHRTVAQSGIIQFEFPYDWRNSQPVCRYETLLTPIIKR